MDLTGPDVLARRVAATPDRTALIDATSGEAQTYADLDASVADLGGRLAAAGVEAGDTVGVLLETSIEAAEVVHAVFRVGATLVPLDPRLEPPELAERIETADVGHLVCGAGTTETARQATEHLPVQPLSIEPVDGMATIDTREPVEVPLPSRSAADRMVVAFTSGTTGTPKAVALNAGNLSASVVAAGYRLGVVPGDRWLLALPIHHVGGLAPLIRTAVYGTAVVVQEGFDPRRLARATRAHGVTGVSLVPTMLRRVLDVDSSLSDSLRFVLLGGAAAPADLIERCERLSVPVYPTYGTTETASQVATATPREAFDHEGTVGQPLLGTEVTIVGADGTEQPAGEVGEIVVSGPTVAPGYLGDGSTELVDGATENNENEGKTAERESPFGPRGFYTGDLGYRDDAGRLWVTGRLNDLIVTGGENVSPGEVEGVLREHPAVRDAAVVGLADREWGERVAALVVRDEEAGTCDDRGVGADALRTHCRERIADFKRPRTIRFADDIPRTASGTVDREAVRDRLAGCPESPTVRSDDAD